MIGLVTNFESVDVRNVKKCNQPEKWVVFYIWVVFCTVVYVY